MPAAQRRKQSSAKRPTNVSLDEALLSNAKQLNINVSQAAEKGLVQAIADKRTQIWLAENQEALDSSNDYVAKHGLPLGRYRQF